MKCKGKIKNINHIVISDPSYDKDVSCRYEKDNLKEKNWLVNFEINQVEEDNGKFIEQGTEFNLLLKKNKTDCELLEDGIRHLSNIQTKRINIGIDTACVALGINSKAKEIIDSKKVWQPKCALKTFSDGIFGELIEGVKNDKLSFVFLSGYVRNDMGYGVDDIFHYLKNQFEMTELLREITSENERNINLRNETMVELSSCSIKNDIDEVTEIRNKDYKEETDGFKLTITESDGSITKTTIHNDNLVTNYPIEVEIISSWYDYETGYHYKGRVTNEILLEEFRKFGTTDFIPDDYIKCKDKSIYKEIKETFENYDPSIVYFSEFDVVRKLKKDISLDVGM